MLHLNCILLIAVSSTDYLVLLSSIDALLYALIPHVSTVQVNAAP